MFSLEEKRTPLLLAYDLQLFANDEGGEKTEEPTAKKIEDSRKEGQVAKSKELTSSMYFLIFGVISQMKQEMDLRMCVHGRSCLIRYSILRLRLHRLLYLHL